MNEPIVIKNLKDAIDIAHSNADYVSLVHHAYSNRVKAHITEGVFEEYLSNLEFLNEYLSEKLGGILVELGDEFDNEKDEVANE